MIRRWYVIEDDTPILPEHPLTIAEAIDLFREAADDDDEIKVEIHQCSEDDLDWAGGAS